MSLLVGVVEDSANWIQSNSKAIQTQALKFSFHFQTSENTDNSANFIQIKLEIDEKQ
jgi:hypothetical protein